VRKISSFKQEIIFLGQSLALALGVGILSGSASAFFLVVLEKATNYRESHTSIIALLPLGGLIVGLAYHYWGQNVVKGNNQILEEYHQPKQVIPLRMAFLVLFGTVVTHIFGGSAGREGTAVQMGGSLADQLGKWLKINPEYRQTLLTMGMSAGFASVFGTPLAGTVFALEVIQIGKIRYNALVPSFLAAIIADYTCHAWQVGHTSYSINQVPDFTPAFLAWAIVAGICFGLTSRLFSEMAHFWSNLFKKYITYPPLRPVLGGIIISSYFFMANSTRYLGLGVPIIVASFSKEGYVYDFLAKTLLTTFTLGAGFKGGEVTPLFFVGATLGNTLSNFIPLGTSLLAGMGFIAVFAGATHTPIACLLMGIELFGAKSGVYLATACIIAYLFSGHTGIYSSQIVGSAKHKHLQHQEGKKLSEL